MSPQRGSFNQLQPYSKIIIAIVVIIAIAFLLLLVRLFRNRLPKPETAGGGAFPEMSVKPKPVNKPFKGCPPEGDGGDPALNVLKNRVDQGSYMPLQFDVVEKLPWPKAIERRDRNKWSADDMAAVTRYEGTPIAVEGYLADAKKEGPESPNCHGADDDFRDFHIWLTKEAGEDRANSIVVEMTPSLRANHPNWSSQSLRNIINNKQRVRISGWLLLDPEHPDQVGKTRGTIWEIHPIMQIEVQQQGRWIPLDNYS